MALSVIPEVGYAYNTPFRGAAQLPGLRSGHERPIESFREGRPPSRQAFQESQMVVRAILAFFRIMVCLFVRT
jgi:hypothetical protein